MPEIKRIFQAGKMNRDLDDRLLPAGQYRAALNVNIGRSEGSDIGAIENLLGNELIGSNDYIPNGTVIGAYRDNGNERIYFFVTNNSSADESNPADAQHGIYEYNQNSRLIRRLVFHNDLNFHILFKIHSINLVDDLLFWTDNRNQPRKINIDLARNDADHYIPGTDNNIDDTIAVAKYSPFLAPTITATGTDNVETGEVISSNFMEDKLLRFAYRWKYEDGEYSTISPFTAVVFDSLQSIPSMAEANSSNEVREFVNTIKSVALTTPIPSGFRISEVELIYKEANNTTLYIVESKPASGLTEELFLYNSQDPFRAIPGSQLTRVYDAVPRLARTQEIAGSRLVFGDYLQNYNVPLIDFTANVEEDADGRHPRFSRHSVKSRRTYQVGIVLADRQGRQTPVILSSSGNDTIFVPAESGTADQVSQTISIAFSNEEEIPTWAHSYRVVVKQRQQEYYNWFSATSGNFQSRTGDGVNKIPIDQTALVDQDATTRPSSRSVFVKLNGNANVADNNQYRVSAIDQQARVVGLVPGNVYETVPTESNLDIFFETSTGGLIQDLRDNPGQRIDVDFFNCYLVDYEGAHIEANRLRMGFNEPAFDVGVRAYVVQENFAEERRFNTLIHSSGVFNNRTGFNQINQFNEAEGGLTISLDPNDGSVQRLYAEDTQLIIFQEDKVSRSPIDKDFIYSAEGGAVPVTSNAQFLGTIAPYAGEYGISSDPQSLAIYGTRKYFTDRNRGVVIRLSQDGLTEISKAGMSDFFRDAFRTSSEIIGSFDEYSDTYNLTIIGTGYSANKDTNIATASERYFTISFEEDVNGWSSFKSFRQEAGTTLNNRYYTFGNGQLWQHNSETSLRNSFYGSDPAPSYVDVIFNDSPSLVKNFQTLGYEGSEGWECTYIDTDLDLFGTLPPVQDASRVTLQITGAVDNGTVSGEQVFIEAPFTTLKWTIVVSPVSSLYAFEPVADPEDLLEQARITTTAQGVTIINPTEIVNGNLVFEVEYTVGTDDEIIPIIVDGSIDAVFEVSLLTVTVDDQVSNAAVGPTILRFTTAGADTATVDVIPSEGFHIPTGPNVTVTSGEEYIDEDLIVVTRSGNDYIITIPATVPTSPDSAGVQISSTAIANFILTYIYDDSTVDNINSTLSVPGPLNPSPFATLGDQVVTVTTEGNFVIEDGDLTLTDDLVELTQSSAVINDTFNQIVYTLEYDPAYRLTANTTVNIDLTGAVTPAAFMMDDLITFATSFEAQTVNNNYAGNIPFVLTVPAAAWLTTNIDQDTGVVSFDFAENTEANGNTVTAVLSNPNPDLYTFDDVEFDIVQPGGSQAFTRMTPTDDWVPTNILRVDAAGGNFRAGNARLVAVRSSSAATPTWTFPTLTDFINTPSVSTEAAFAPYSSGITVGFQVDANTTGAERTTTFQFDNSIANTLFTVIQEA